MLDFYLTDSCFFLWRI